MSLSIIPNINPNRIITLTYSDNTGTSSVSERSWRNNMRRLLTSLEKAKQGIYRSPASSFMFDPKESSKWDVHENIQLLINENKGLAIDNVTDTPFQALSNITQNSGMVGKIATLAVATTTLLSAFGDDYNEGTTSGVFNPWMSEIPAWKGGKKAEITYTFDFAMGQYGMWNALEEVVKPILNLAAPCIPQFIDFFMQNGAFPTSWDLISNVIRQAFDAFSDTKDVEYDDDYTPNDEEVNKRKSAFENFSKELEKILLAEYKTYTYDMKFGNMMMFYKMLPVGVKVNFSNEVDQMGFPISGSAELTFRGVLPLTISSLTDEERALVFNGSPNFKTPSSVNRNLNPRL